MSKLPYVPVVVNNRLVRVLSSVRLRLLVPSVRLLDPVMVPVLVADSVLISKDNVLQFSRFRLPLIALRFVADT